MESARGRILAAGFDAVEYLELRGAVDLAPMVLKLIDSGASGVPAAGAAGQGQTDNSFKTTLLAEPRSNALVLRAANPARIATVIDGPALALRQATRRRNGRPRRSSSVSSAMPRPVVMTKGPLPPRTAAPPVLRCNC